MEYVEAKNIVIRNKSTAWFGAAYNMNIYRGCCHGCIYCDSRCDCYHVDSFDQVRAKKDALRIIRNDLRRKVKTAVIATGAMSDPYNPFERELELTRHALELVDAYEFGIAIATKSDLILRDIDVLKQIQQHSPAIAKLSITTADDLLAQKIEPHVASSSRRFEVVRTLAAAGIFTGILMMPILPYLEDTEENIGAIVRLAADNGARFVYPALGVTLRQNQRTYYLEKVNQWFPGMRQKYERQYGNRYDCTSPKAKKLWTFFAASCEQYGLLYRMQDIIKAYKMGYGNRQLSFLV